MSDPRFTSGSTRPSPFSGPSKRLRTPGTENPIEAIGPEAEFDGLLVLQGPARIEGWVSGEILSDETVWIGESAHVEARVTAANVIVAGWVQGDITASGRIALESTAQVTGELTAQRLVLVEGSYLEGTCHAGDPKTPDSEEPAR